MCGLSFFLQHQTPSRLKRENLFAGAACPRIPPRARRPRHARSKRQPGCRLLQPAQNAQQQRASLPTHMDAEPRYTGAAPTRRRTTATPTTYTATVHAGGRRLHVGTSHPTAVAAAAARDGALGGASGWRGGRRGGSELSANGRCRRCGAGSRPPTNWRSLATPPHRAGGSSGAAGAPPRAAVRRVRRVPRARGGRGAAQAVRTGGRGRA